MGQSGQSWIFAIRRLSLGHRRGPSQVQRVQVSGMTNRTQLSAEASDSLVFALLAVIVIAAVGFLAYMLWEPSREEGAKARAVIRMIWLRVFTPVKRLSPGRWALALALIGVFATAWWLVRRDAAEELDRAETSQIETVNSRLYPPRSTVLVEARERVATAQSRYNRDSAVGFGVGLSAVVLTLAAVVLWQRLHWDHAGARPGDKGDADSASARRDPHASRLSVSAAQ